MEAKVLKDFSCRLGGGLFAPGDAYEGEPERIAELADGGYVEAPKPEGKATKRRTTRKTDTKE